MKVLGILSLLSLIGFGIAKLYPIEPRNPLSGIAARPGSIWPQPFSDLTSDVRVTLDPANFKFDTSSVSEKCDPLEFSLEKYNKEFLFFIPEGVSAPSDPNYPVLSKVDIRITGLNGEGTECANFPKLNENSENEYYELDIFITTDVIATIEAKTVWGALRGIETFSQIIWTNENYENGPLHFYVNATTIMDYPRFPHRGLMVDSARHYLPEKTFYSLLDGMMYNKLNVFHWHIVDDQSFPYVSKKFPDLSAKGAYSPRHIYTPEMVQRVIEAGRLRGIRVLIEFDTPGHTHGFGKAYPELLTPCYGTPGVPGTPNFPEHADKENLDPTKEFTYTFMKDFFSELVNDVSKDKFLHIGMDEVYPPCWESSPEIKAFMTENNYTATYQVQQHYTEKHVEMIKTLGVTPISWQDPLDFGVQLSKDVVVQIWKDWGLTWPEYMRHAITSGYKVILSAPWYINYIDYGESWRKYYLADPILNVTGLTESQQKQILGGEACLWAEFIDKTNILPRLFPFASAVAERLWSTGIPIEGDVANDARERLDIHRCRMLQRGLPAQPIHPGYCGPWDLEDI